MTMKKWGLIASTFVLAFVCCNFDGCDETASQPTANSGVTKADVKVTAGADGLTAEQRNIKARLVEDNKPGAVKHLYVISPYSGQVILYSTVKGKVTSGGKRLSPTQANSAYIQNEGWAGGFRINTPTGSMVTSEVLQDDGTYGSSGDYLYWWDVRGSYHQHYLTGGQIVTISDQPLPVKSITINIEAGARE